MATAKKMKSGSWRCLVYSHTESVKQKDGSWKDKRIYKSFTCDDATTAAKRKAEAIAAEYALNKDNYTPSRESADFTLKEAALDYCDIKSSVLSPSTIRAYKNYIKNKLGALENQKINDITSVSIQRHVNSLLKEHSVKYTKNVYGLITAVLGTYVDGFHVHVSLPTRPKRELTTSSDSEIADLIEFFKHSDKKCFVLFISPHSALCDVLRYVLSLPMM